MQEVFTPIKVRVEELSKTYGPTKALKQVNLEFQGGEVHALMGENGSGKSTLVKLLSGIVSPTSGHIYIDGARVEFAGPREAMAQGIGTIHQDTSLVPDLTVAENIMLGHEDSHPAGILHRTGYTESKKWLDSLEADISPNVLGRDLTQAQKQMVAIAKALSGRSRLLIFDEPTAALGEEETEHLINQIASLKARGIGIIYISHRIAEVSRISDRLSILKDGVLTRTGDNDVSSDEIIRLMVGREPDALFPTLAPPRETVAIQATQIKSTDGFVNIENFAIHQGEVVGIAGLEGSGRSTLARILAGVEKPSEGVLSLHGKENESFSPSQAVRAGISYVPPDRRRESVIAQFSVAKTITMSSVSRFSKFGVLDRTRELEESRAIAQDMGIKAPDVRQSITTLSGGNQQKAVLSRAIAAQSSVLVCDEPTAGVDVGARKDIYENFADLAADGMAIILSSSDMVELIGLCHRIVVMRSGSISANLLASEATEEILMEAQLPDA